MTTPKPDPKLYYFTFGVQWTKRHPHPTGLGYRGSNYLKVQGLPYEDARNLVNGLTQGEWAGQYHRPPKALYAPEGCVQSILITDNGATDGES